MSKQNKWPPQPESWFKRPGEEYVPFDPSIKLLHLGKVASVNHVLAQTEQQVWVHLSGPNKGMLLSDDEISQRVRRSPPRKSVAGLDQG